MRTIVINGWALVALVALVVAAGAVGWAVVKGGAAEPAAEPAAAVTPVPAAQPRVAAPEPAPFQTYVCDMVAAYYRGVLWAYPEVSHAEVRAGFVEDTTGEGITELMHSLGLETVSPGYAAGIFDSCVDELLDTHRYEREVMPLS